MRKEPLFVCLCKVVTEGQVGEAIDRGACSIAEVGEHCGAGTGCGACHEQIQDMIDSELGAGARPCGGGHGLGLVTIAATLNSR